ncbi:putative transcription factor SOX-14 isoform X2 [Hyla sarda]|uniref:putative transcription factor SOX-14 isoform X2 n=1 Tax=Hyla sarda TaxID=327740 RepID=UPI0024C21D83|nr:putative transcription factor SOX-14 isoform X2 [Hyla sarda]
MGLTRQMRAHPIQVEEKAFDYKDSTSGVLGETNDPLSSPDGSNTRMICSVKGASGAQSLTADNTDILSPASNPNKNREKCTENLNINEEEQSKNIPFLTMEGEEEEPRYSDDLLQKAMELCGLQNEGGTAHSQTIDLTIALPKDLNPPKTFYTLPAETQTPPQYFPSSKRTQSRLHQEPLVKLNTENVSFMLPPSKSEKPYVPFGYNSSGNIKQPMNSYMIWRRIHHSALARANPTASSRDINIQLGWEWRRLTEEQKKTYYIEAWKLRTIHREMFPDWTFTRRTDKNEKALPMAIYNSSTPTMSPYTHTTECVRRTIINSAIP